jgi:hypothetical protein
MHGGSLDRQNFIISMVRPAHCLFRTSTLVLGWYPVANPLLVRCSAVRGLAWPARGDAYLDTYAELVARTRSCAARAAAVRLGMIPSARGVLQHLVLLLPVSTPQATARQRCGLNWDDANSKCGTPCPKNLSEECPAPGENCFSELSVALSCGGRAPPPPPPPPPHGPPPNPSQRCGKDFNDANQRCGTFCPENTSEECPHGEDCWSELDVAPCTAGAIAAVNACASALARLCVHQEHDACKQVCTGIGANGAPVLPPVPCRAAHTSFAIARYCRPVACEWWQNRHFSATQVVQAYRHFAYAGHCIPTASACLGGSAITGSTLNNQLPTSVPICGGGHQQCCVKTYPNEPLQPAPSTITLARTIVRSPKCAVVCTDGLRPPYVHFDDDHRSGTAMAGLDATIHAYVVIPCTDVRSAANPAGIAMGESA